MWLVQVLSAVYGRTYTDRSSSDSCTWGWVCLLQLRDEFSMEASVFQPEA